MSWKSAVHDSGKGYYTLHTQEIGSVPVRLFLTPNLLLLSRGRPVSVQTACELL